MSGKRMRKCPFCGGQARLQITDEEGNFHGEEYLDDPWSGLGYVIVHHDTLEDQCPIACYKGEHVGTYIYDTPEAAIAAWNGE